MPGRGGRAGVDGDLVLAVALRRVPGRERREDDDMTNGPVNDAALAQLRGAVVSTEELLAKRRVELQAVQAEREALADLIQERRIQMLHDLAALRRLDERAGRLVGFLDARRLNGGQP